MTKLNIEEPVMVIVKENGTGDMSSNLDEVV